MKANGVVFEKLFGSCGERLPHALRVRLVDGGEFCLDGRAAVGASVEVSYCPDDQFAKLVRVLS